MYQLFRNKITESKLAFFILGFITSFAFAPYFIFPLVILFVFLILVINYNFYGRKKYFKIFALSIGHFVGCTYWVNHALLIDIWRHFWLTPFATLLLPAYMTLFPMLTILLTEKIIKNKPSILTIIGFSLAWVITEMLREMLLTGFPWNNLGYSLNFTLQTMQMAAVGGIYLNSFIVLMLGGFVFLFYHKRQKLYLFYTLLLLSVLYLTGENRLRNNITNFSEQKVRVVQGNIAQELKWEKEEKLANIYKYMRLSQHSKAAEIIVWPESAVAFSLNNNINILNLLSDIIPENGYLITGALRYQQKFNDIKIWNSLFVLNHNGNIINYYDKSKLLPFGEYIPLRKWLPLEKITAGTIDFSEGSPKIMKVNNINILPLICSESIFSPYYISQLDKNIDLIVNITNDGWFKDSVGAYHHYQMARTRAVELGVPLVRAANTGISAIVDSVGREIKKSNLLEDWSYVVNLPKPIKNGTYYARFLQKNYPFAVVIKLFIVISLLINYYIKRNN